MSSQTMPLRRVLKWLQLALRLPLRPLERFLHQWLAVSTRPRSFVREQVRLNMLSRRRVGARVDFGKALPRSRSSENRPERGCSKFTAPAGRFFYREGNGN